MKTWTPADWDRFNDPVVDAFRAHAGRVPGRGPTLLLTTIGAQTGLPRMLPLNFSRDGDRYVVIGSKGGSPTHPALVPSTSWRTPIVTIEVGTRGRHRGVPGARVAPPWSRSGPGCSTPRSRSCPSSTATGAPSPTATSRWSCSSGSVGRRPRGTVTEADVMRGSRIERVEVFGYDLRYAHGSYVMSGGRVDRPLASTVVRVTTADGAVGYGEACPLGTTYLPAHAEGRAPRCGELAPAVFGRRCDGSRRRCPAHGRAPCAATP